jgi:hypothetical protein
MVTELFVDVIDGRNVKLSLSDVKCITQLRFGRVWLSLTDGDDIIARQVTLRIHELKVAHREYVIADSLEYDVVYRKGDDGRLVQISPFSEIKLKNNEVKYIPNQELTNIN